MIYLESRGKRYTNCSMSFKWNDKDYEFNSTGAKDLYRDIIDWLYTTGYNFDGSYHINPTRKIHTTEEVKQKISKTAYSLKDFHNISDTDKWIMCATPIRELFSGLIKMLKLYSVESIKTTGLDLEDIDDSKILTNNDSDNGAKIKKFGEIDDLSPIEEEPISKIKVYEKNPFKQSICVLGESGSGKSVTIENILENEDHNFEFIIPTAATTGLLAQFSPSRSTYVPSRLGKMLIESSNNPDKLYTAVFDEMHKSNVIEMINDELLQAISTKRNKGVRFISLDDDTSEIYSESNLETKRGNLIIPDNFGFIFISSKPRVISNNSDFFNRVDIVTLKEENRSINSSEELLNLKISEEEKRKLSSSRND